MRPIDICTEETLEFVCGKLDARHRRLLEVGSGDGALASRLQRLGYEVIAIDSSPEAVDEARRLGVDARVAEWPEFDASPVDAILFTRSLHHIHSLDAALRRAIELLNPLGLVIVEDFAYTEAEQHVVRWLHDLLDLLQSCSALLTKDRDDLVSSLLRGGGEMEIWLRWHDHDLHTGEAMRSALKANLLLTCDEAAPYLYRYLTPYLADSPEGGKIMRRVLAMERHAALAGGLKLIGRRFVGRKPEGESSARPQD